jgi:hypothetical protein
LRAAQRKLAASQTSLVIVGSAQLFLSARHAKYPSHEIVALTQLNLDSARLRLSRF